MRRFSALFVALLLALTALLPAASAQSSGAEIELDGSRLGKQAVIDGASVYLPVRSLGEALGYTVSWSAADGVSTVSLKKDGDIIALNLADSKIDDNGHSYYAQAENGAGIEVISGSAYLESKLFDAIFSTETEYESGNNLVTLSSVKENAVSITTEKLSYNEKYLDLTIQYPQLSGLSDTKVQDTVNTVLKQAALDAESEGKKNAEEMEQWVSEGYTGGVTTCEVYFDYNIYYNQNGLLSVVLTNYQYTGGAHGSTIQSSYTFDLATGKALSLSDLMVSGSSYVAYINSGIRAKIDRKEALGELAELDSYEFTSISNDPAYYLTNSGIEFYFQQYEHFPYAAGIQTFQFSYSELKDFLKQEYSFL